jgi:hypothetical protein
MLCQSLANVISAVILIPSWISIIETYQERQKRIIYNEKLNTADIIIINLA